MKNVGIAGMPVVIRTGYLQNISVDRYHHTILLAVQVLKVNHRNNENVFLKWQCYELGQVFPVFLEAPLREGKWRSGGKTTHP
jgi:hypothetical protein